MRNFLIMMERFIDLKLAFANSGSAAEAIARSAKLDEQRAQLMKLAQEMDNPKDIVHSSAPRSPND